MYFGFFVGFYVGGFLGKDVGTSVNIVNESPWIWEYVRVIAQRYKHIMETWWLYLCGWLLSVKTWTCAFRLELAPGAKVVVSALPFSFFPFIFLVLIFVYVHICKTCVCMCRCENADMCRSWIRPYLQEGLWLTTLQFWCLPPPYFLSLHAVLNEVMWCGDSCHS